MLAKELLGSKVEINLDISVYDIASLDRKFDIIFFFGVYYHLLDPFYALAQTRHCCHSDTVVLVHGAEAATLSPATALYDLSNHACEWMAHARSRLSRGSDGTRFCLMSRAARNALRFKARTINHDLMRIELHDKIINTTLSFNEPASLASQTRITNPPMPINPGDYPSQSSGLSEATGL